MASLEVLLGVAAAVVLLGVLAVRVSVRLGLPSLLLYLGIGILLGESVLGIRFSDAGLTEAAGLGALVLILAEGGITTRWAAVRPALGVGIALSTVAVMVSIGVVGAALHLILDLEWRTAFLWGAVLSSTDAAAVFSVLRGTGVSQRLGGVLEVESGMNDAPGGLAVVLLASDDPITWLTPLLVLYELGLGAVIGYGLGVAGAWAVRRAALPATGLYPLATLAVCLLAYSAGQLAHASGLLATYVAALVLGNSNLPHRSDFLSWSGLRGAVPIVLALIALQEGAPNAQALVDLVFVLVVVLTLLQGTTLPFVARRLGVIASEPQELEVDAAPLDELGADLLQVRVPAGPRVRGVHPRELRLPPGATVSLVVRDEEAFTPSVDTRLRVGDQLLVVTTAAARVATEQRIRAVDRAGRLARWHGESGH